MLRKTKNVARVAESYERDALMALRGQPDYTLVATLARIGSRYSKGFAAVSSGKTVYMFSLVSSLFSVSDPSI